jgi:hypothetical protein
MKLLFNRAHTPGLICLVHETRNVSWGLHLFLKHRRHCLWGHGWAPGTDHRTDLFGLGPLFLLVRVE